MYVGNFTPDEIKWQHIGVEGVIKPDEVLEFEDSRARHILNKYATRGLVQMGYGDDKIPKRKEGMARWKTFWEEQIVTFNRHNEDQKEKGNRYANPTPELKEHADKLGLDILRPWRIETKDSPKMAELERENRALNNSLAEMKDQIAQLMDMVKGTGLLAAHTIEKKDDTAVNRNKYKRLGESNMILWVNKNWEDIQNMPEENQIEIRKKYEDIYSMPFPDEKPGADDIK